MLPVQTRGFATLHPGLYADARSAGWVSS